MKTDKNIILLADDDVDDQIIITEIFTQHSNDVSVVNVQDGEEALRMIERMEKQDIFPCLIILDLNMPKLDGRQTLLRIKAQQKLAHVPLVLFSTSSEKRDKDFAKLHGASYVVKPFSYQNLQAVVQGFIKQCVSN